jgi:hypothetical protein
VPPARRGRPEGTVERRITWWQRALRWAALCLLRIPGLPLVWYNLIPFFKRGNEFQVHPDGSVSVRRGDSWEPLMEYQYSTVTADGTTIDFTPPAVFSRQYGVRLPGKVSAEFFRRLLAGRGFDVESVSSSSNSFTARRKSPTVVRAD